jgi:hypothetical protein
MFRVHQHFLHNAHLYVDELSAEMISCVPLSYFVHELKLKNICHMEQHQQPVALIHSHGIHNSDDENDDDDDDDNENENVCNEFGSNENYLLSRGPRIAIMLSSISPDKSTERKKLVRLIANIISAGQFSNCLILCAISEQCMHQNDFSQLDSASISSIPQSSAYTDFVRSVESELQSNTLTSTSSYNNSAHATKNAFKASISMINFPFHHKLVLKSPISTFVLPSCAGYSCKLQYQLSKAMHTDTQLKSTNAAFFSPAAMPFTSQHVAECLASMLLTLNVDLTHVNGVQVFTPVTGLSSSTNTGAYRVDSKTNINS